MSSRTFLARLPQDAIEEREIIETAFRIVDVLRGKATEIRSNTHLTKVGQDEQVKIAAKGGLAEQFKQLQSRAARMTEHASNLRQGFKLKPLDKADLVGELQRREMRDFLRSQPEDKRIRIALEDPNFSEAIIHALSPALSGLSPEVHARVKHAAIERAYGPQMRGLAQREELNETVTNALQVAAMQFRNEAGLKDGEI